MERFMGVLGIAAILGLAWLFSTNRKAIRPRTVLWGLGLQLTFAFLVLKWDAGRALFQALGDFVTQFLGYAFAGSEFLFGPMGARGAQPYVLAFQVLPVIIFIAAFFSVLYHYGIMQFIIKLMAKLMMRVMGTSGAESMNVAASIFMGCTEAPLSIRPFLENLTESELMTVMTSGMAHISGAVMAAYILFGARAEHLLSAVIMTAPGTLMIAKMLVPETGQPETAGTVKVADAGRDRSENLLGAIARGTTDGLHLALNVAAMLIAFIALVAVLNGSLGGVHYFLNARGIPWFPQNMQAILGPVFSPMAWLIGIPWKDCLAIGNLLGTRMVLNEFVAFRLLGDMKTSLDPRSFTIATFALCGFANLGNIGIEIGGISALAPSRRNDLARLGFKAMLAGTMANLLSAAIAGMLL